MAARVSHSSEQEKERADWAPLEFIWDLAMPEEPGVALGRTKA